MVFHLQKLSGKHSYIFFFYNNHALIADFLCEDRTNFQIALKFGENYRNNEMKFPIKLLFMETICNWYFGCIGFLNTLSSFGKIIEKTI